MEGSIAILSGDGHLIASSPELASAVTAGGQVMEDKQGRLGFRDGETQKSFAVALKALRVPSPQPIPQIFKVKTDRHRTTAVLQCLLSAKDASDPKNTAFLLVLCKRGSLEGISKELLRQHYGLSKAEAAAVLAIASGSNVSEAANKREITTTTARNQLAAAMIKIGVRRQAAVVAAVSCLMPRLRLGPPEV